MMRRTVKIAVFMSRGFDVRRCFFAFRRWNEGGEDSLPYGRGSAASDSGVAILIPIGSRRAETRMGWELRVGDFHFSEGKKLV
jgi:hypothetical protein